MQGALIALHERPALVACLHCPPRMNEREPILPPPPSTRLALWAVLNALWFRVVDTVVRRLGGAVRVARRGVALLGPEEGADRLGSITVLAREGRLSSLLGRLAMERSASSAPRPRRPAPGDDRPTAVEVRRAG
jgi:hypothetical protein